MWHGLFGIAERLRNPVILLRAGRAIPVPGRRIGKDRLAAQGQHGFAGDEGHGKVPACLWSSPALRVLSAIDPGQTPGDPGARPAFGRLGPCIMRKIPPIRAARASLALPCA